MSLDCLNLKMSRAAFLSHFTSLSVVKLKENCLSLSEFKFSQKGRRLSRFYFMCCRYFGGMSLVGMYPGRASFLRRWFERSGGKIGF